MHRSDVDLCKPDLTWRLSHTVGGWDMPGTWFRWDASRTRPTEQELSAGCSPMHKATAVRMIKMRRNSCLARGNEPTIHSLAPTWLDSRGGAGSFDPRRTRPECGGLVPRLSTQWEAHPGIGFEATR
ncbi:hypothetical protein GCM10010102_18460 [Promicromonospora citrea]|uniref:Uncharacterized protein n=1 Tax=Promicromonospora citrea TaxID=43677 RepID=A0A8H9GG66_9MICO|nr:hypothetical protein GCM10010102_18460 [Promicromonospora citrea]